MLKKIPPEEEVYISLEEKEVYIPTIPPEKERYMPICNFCHPKDKMYPLLEKHLKELSKEMGYPVKEDLYYRSEVFRALWQELKDSPYETLGRFLRSLE